MVNIALIDDDPKDIQKITTILTPLAKSLPYQLSSLTTLEQGQRYLKSHTIDLLLLDLEFAKAKSTSIYFLEELDSSVPVLIVSHLTHYQRQLNLKANVIGFIPKNKLETLLVPAVTDYLIPAKDASAPREFIFPASSREDIPVAFSVADILYIEIESFRTYRIHCTQKPDFVLSSVSFHLLCDELTKQKIRDLKPISRNQIININYIKEVHLEKNSRITLSLIGVPTVFTVGKNHTAYFRDWYVE